MHSTLAWFSEMFERYGSLLICGAVLLAIAAMLCRWIASPLTVPLVRPLLIAAGVAVVVFFILAAFSRFSM